MILVLFRVLWERKAAPGEREGVSGPFFVSLTLDGKAGRKKEEARGRRATDPLPLQRYKGRFSFDIYFVSSAAE